MGTDQILFFKKTCFMLSDCNASIPTVDGEPKGCFLFKNYMITAYHVPSIVPATILSIRDTAVNKTDKNP